jgi:sialidase-1
MATDRDERVKEVLSLPPADDNPRNSEGDIIQMRDGKLLLAYSHFTAGSGDNARAHIAARWSADAGLIWGADLVMFPREGAMNDMSVSLLRLASGSIAIFYLVKNSMRDCRAFMRISHDEAQSWSDPKLVTPRAGYHVVNNARVVQLSSRRLVVPAALHDWPGEHEGLRPGAAMCFLSDDEGRTWRRSKSVLQGPPQSASGLQEPGVVELKDGSLLMLCRTDQGMQFRSHSQDGGETWSPADPSDIESPCSPATLRRLPRTGELIMIWNDHSGEFARLGEKRTPLATAISRDEGKTWTSRKILEDDPDGWFCYTSCTFVGDAAFLSYCAGGKDVGRLNRLRVLRIEQSWFAS